MVPVPWFQSAGRSSGSPSTAATCSPSTSATRSLRIADVDRAHLQRPSVHHDPGLRRPAASVHAGWHEPGQRNSTVQHDVAGGQHWSGGQRRNLVDGEFDGIQTALPARLELGDGFEDRQVELLRPGTGSGQLRRDQRGSKPPAAPVAAGGAVGRSTRTRSGSGRGAVFGTGFVGHGLGQSRRARGRSGSRRQCELRATRASRRAVGAQPALSGEAPPRCEPNESCRRSTIIRERIAAASSNRASGAPSRRRRSARIASPECPECGGVARGADAPTRRSPR